MSKAFLSHNHVDKDFVLEVGRELGYSETIVDSFNFNEGKDFRNQIRDYLKQSKLFVLFASKESLSAPWVRYEIDLAEMFILNGEITNVLVFLIGEATHNDLPSWLKNSLVKNADNAKIVATTIKTHLRTRDKDKLYIGRGEIQNKFDTEYFTTGNDIRNIIIHGIPGIGRKTFAKNVIKNTFSLSLSTEYKLEESEPLVALYRELLIDFHEIKTIKQFHEYKQIFIKLNLIQQVEEIIKYLNRYAEHKQVPVFIDDTRNGVLNSKGHFNSDILELLKQINNTDKLFSVFILQRNVKDFINKNLYFSIYIPNLNRGLTEHLLKQYCNHIYDIQISKNDAQIVGEYLDGYPPKVELASYEINERGIDIVKNRPSYFNQYGGKAFEEYLEKYVVNNDAKQLLKYLNNFNNELTLPILDLLVPDCIDQLEILLDVNIVKVNHETNTYYIVQPLVGHIADKYGILSKKEYSEWTIKLKERFWNEDDLVNTNVLNTIITSLLRSDSTEDINEFKEIIIPSDIFKTAKSAYINKNWKLARNLFEQLLKVDKTNASALEYLIRTKIRLGEDDSEDLENLKYMDKDKFDLVLAFKLVKRNSFEKAIELLEKIKEKKYFPPYVYRELGECYFQIGEYEAVQSIITESLKEDKNKNNRYMLDLAAKNSIKIENYALAEEYIKLLEQVDDAGSVSHRKATLYFKQEMLEEALAEATEAVNSKNKRLEFFLLEANILLDLNEIEKANKVLTNVEQNYKGLNIRNDGGFKRLKCIYYIKTSDIEKAESILRSMPKNKRTYLEIELLKLKISDSNINLLKREELKLELSNLEKIKVDNILIDI